MRTLSERFQELAAHPEKDEMFEERRELISYRLVRTFAWLSVLVLVGWLVMLSSLNALVQMGSSADVIFDTLQIFTWIALVGGVAVMLWDLWQVWTGKRRWWSKLWES